MALKLLEVGFAVLIRVHLFLFGSHGADNFLGVPIRLWITCSAPALRWAWCLGREQLLGCAVAWARAGGQLLEGAPASSILELGGNFVSWLLATGTSAWLFIFQAQKFGNEIETWGNTSVFISSMLSATFPNLKKVLLFSGGDPHLTSSLYLPTHASALCWCWNSRRSSMPWMLQTRRAWCAGLSFSPLPFIWTTLPRQWWRGSCALMWAL